MSHLLSTDRIAEWAARLTPSSPDAGATALPARLPLHVVYGGAQRFAPDITAKLGRIALHSLEAYAPDPSTFAEAIGLDPSHAAPVYERVQNKLAVEPVEDYRIDFEDGYGARADDEEDAHARAVGTALAEGLDRGVLPPSIGIRIKALNPATATRALRTLSLVFGAVGDNVPPGFVVTLPKVANRGAVEIAAEALAEIEHRRGWGSSTLKLEIMIEDPQLWFDNDGRFLVPHLVDASRGRLVAAHLGPYDYTASLGIAGADQSLFHPALEVARHLMQIAFRGTDVRLGDGPTMLMPIAPHREASLDEAQKRENRAVVHEAWRHHADAVRASMRRGFDVGWDLHPAQIPARLGAVYAAYRSQLPAVAERLRNFVNAAGQATRVGAVFDDAATGQGLVNFCLRALHTGAVTEDEIVMATGLSRTLLATRSFAAIVQASEATRPG